MHYLLYMARDRGLVEIRHFVLLKKLHELLVFQKGDLTTFWDLRILILGNECTLSKAPVYNSYQILNANHLFRIINILSKAPAQSWECLRCVIEILKEMTWPHYCHVHCWWDANWFCQEIHTKRWPSEEPYISAPKGTFLKMIFLFPRWDLFPPRT